MNLGESHPGWLPAANAHFCEFFLPSAEEGGVMQCLLLYWLLIFGVYIDDLYPMAVFGIINPQNSH